LIITSQKSYLAYTIVTLAVPDPRPPSRTCEAITYAATRHPWETSTRLPPKHRWSKPTVNRSTRQRDRRSQIC